ncbi:MAG TPA: hypothetical protein VNN18_04980 [Candidatus Xenobia bacterium]|nr:hypothetical protein [Candidatus Xenobia bacterium]
MNRLSKGFYVGSVAVGLGLGILVIVITAVLMIGLGGNISEDEAALAIIPAALLMLYGVVVMLMLWYKAWAAIQDGQARTTPGKAVGFLFIPLFNLYWIFQAIHGFAKDYNSYVTRHSLNVPKLPEGMFLAYCILVLAGIIPIIGPLFSLAAVGVMIALCAKVCDAVNALPAGTPSA